MKPPNTEADNTDIDAEVENAKEDEENEERLIIDRDTRRNLITWRRDQVVKYWSRGHSVTSIAKKLKVSNMTIHRDLDWLLEQNKQNLQYHLEKGIPQYYMQTMTGLQDVLAESWAALYQLQEDRMSRASDKTALLSLIKECLKSIADLSNSGTVVQQAINFTKNANRKLDNIKTENENENEDSITAVVVPAEDTVEQEQE